MHFSNDYGFGMVDALAAVRLAETWELSQTSANDFETFEDDVNSTVTFDAATQTFTIGEITDIVIEHVSIELDFAHTWLADIELYLTSPEGTRVQLLADTGDSADFDGIWRFGTTAFWGESSAGDWTLTAVDDTGGDSFTIRDADLRTSGNPVTNDDLWIFTNEYSDYAGVAGHGTVFAGGVGVNTLNAAAVTSATTINLLTNTATIDGVSTTNSNITRVFTGDGNDTIVGDSVSRFLDGGRGVDTITGGSANEVIRGGLGDFSDILRGGAGQDSVYGGAGNDIFYFDAASDLVAGETYDGGTGVDSIVILGAGTFDFSTSTVTSTERFFFDNTAATNQTAVLNQSAALGLIPNGFVGNGGTNIVEVVLAASESTNLTNLGLSAWTSGSDQIRITGGSGTNIITGTTRDDSIGGNGGDDVIEGVWGMDSLYGGAGQDKLHVFAGSDIASGEVYDGGSENDSLYLNIKATGVTGSGGIFDFTTAVLTSLEEVDFWGTGAQTVTGVFLGTQFGSGLATTLRLDGWASTDIFQVELGDGEDIDLSGFTFSVFWTDGTDLVRVVGDLGNNEIVGTSRGDHITTGAGIDRLDGGLGADTLDGGLGNDVYTIDNVGDSIINEVTFSTGGGIDTVRSSITYTLGTNLEVLRLQGSANLNGFGNAAPESLVGNTGANTMGAGGGNDIINAKAGDDTLIGGTGRDTMVGDTGADVFVYNSFAESYAGAATRDFLNGFTHGQDVIDLSAIDANPFNAGDQAFTFIGSAAFTGAGSNSAGQLRYFTFSGGNFNIVQADWNGDGVPEMEIFVNGTNFMTGTDFIL
jgi:Ca2+-binding RTX toxin-like protein